jgi:hypothetical protein
MAAVVDVGETSMTVKPRMAYRRTIAGLIEVALIGSLLTVAIAHAPVAEAATLAWNDVNPDTSTNTNANSSTGGRVNGLASASGNNQTFYAASEFGGLFKTTNGGTNWFRLNGHLPTVTWDVEVDPSNNNRVYATSFYDGRVASVSGIQVSTDAGTTWSHPASATPPASGTAPFSSCTSARRTEPSAYGIGIHPTNGAVYVGTNCGVARSTDGGTTWTFSDPTVGDTADDVWDVAVQDDGTTNGIVDVCGNDGALRSTDGGATWTAVNGNLPVSVAFGRCSIAASPDENYVLLFESAGRMFQSNNTGTNWAEFTGASDGSRIPFLTVNQRTTGFDLWVGRGVNLARAACTTPATPAPGGAARCPGQASWTNVQTGAHADTGDVVFDAAVATDRCPRVYSSDGGVHTNTVSGAGCQTPTWTRSNVGLHALWLYSMAGANQAGDSPEDLYMGAQDNGAFGAQNAGAATLSWNFPNCCDVFNVAANSTRVVWDSFSPYSQSYGNPGMTSQTNVATTLPGSGTQGIDVFTFPDNLDSFGTNQYVGVSGSGAFTTSDITASPVVWTALGTGIPAGGFCGVQVAESGGTPTFYAQTGCLGVFESGGNRGPFQLWRLAGTTGTWDRIDDNFSTISGIEIFAVDPTNPNRLYASHLSGPNGARMILSTDGGTTWQVDDDLTDLMDGDGTFRMQTQRGPTSFTGFGGYVQPSLIAFDPEDANYLVAGGRDSGIFVSKDGGRDWVVVSDPLTSNASGIPHIPRPFFAYFDHEPTGTTTVFVGTQGRGVYRLRLRLPTAEAGGPYTTNEGTNVTLNASGSTDPDNQPLTYAWDFDDDGQYDDATGVTPTFDRVGQDGTFTVSVKVTAPGGASDIDDATVTVKNVAPSVGGLASDAPVDEADTVTVTGTVSDPGWLDPLSATIDWGDGSPTAPVSGVLENVRPDATLTFSASHVYGDDGTFTATICGSDDDTSSCASLPLRVENVAPTATIDESGATMVNGSPAFIVSAGAPVTFRATSTDPGSDDLTLTWDWGDGPPAPDVSTTYLVNPPNPDPDPSPSVQPRKVTDEQIHAFAEACLYNITFSAADDDGGNASDDAVVLVRSTASNSRSSGYWQHQYRRQGHTDFTDEQLNCYLAIIDFASAVFSEVRDASTIRAAFDVLNLAQNAGDERQKLDRELLTVWLNFANGAVGYSELFDSDGNGTPDTPFSVIMATAEGVRADPTSTPAQLREQRQIVHRIR